jgi:hypothetical protein
MSALSCSLSRVKLAVVSRPDSMRSSRHHSAGLLAPQQPHAA